jgi:peptide/nickel transport system ATP-binding protein
VVIAGALALEPRVIVADEPVSNLDASVRGEILRLLLELRRTSKITILIVTHDLGLAWMVADRVAVMYLGRIVEIGPTRAVLTDPGHPYTRALLDVAQSGSGQELLTGEPPDPTRIPEGCRFHPRCPALKARKAELPWLEARCLGDDPRTEDTAAFGSLTAHLAACHLATRRAPEEGDGPLTP